jgi:hypothetical protein
MIHLHINALQNLRKDGINGHQTCKLKIIMNLGIIDGEHAPPPDSQSGGGSFYPLPDVPSPGNLLHTGTERNFLCKFYQRGGTHSDPKCPTNFFWYHNAPKIINTSDDT